MTTKKTKIPLWEDGSPKSTNNAFNWRALQGESLMLRDPMVKSQSTLLHGKASGRTPISPKHKNITLSSCNR